MNNNSIEERLKQIKVEDFIWIIYLGIIALSFYSNELETNYFMNKDEVSKDKYKNSLVLIFSILVVVYMYFLKSSVDDINRLSRFDSDNKKKLVYLSFLGSLLIAISGFIFLYIALSDENIDVELAFN